MAKLIWNFDMELNTKSRTWLERSRVFTLWEKPPLLVRLTPVKGSSREGEALGR